MRLNGQFLGLKNKWEMAFLPFKRQFFCFQAVRYAASGNSSEFYRDSSNTRRIQIMSNNLHKDNNLDSKLIEDRIFIPLQVHFFGGVYLTEYCTPAMQKF